MHKLPVAVVISALLVGCAGPSHHRSYSPPAQAQAQTQTQTKRWIDVLNDGIGELNAQMERQNAAAAQRYQEQRAYSQRQELIDSINRANKREAPRYNCFRSGPYVNCNPY